MKSLSILSLCIILASCAIQLTATKTSGDENQIKKPGVTYSNVIQKRKQALVLQTNTRDECYRIPNLSLLRRNELKINCLIER